MKVTVKTATAKVLFVKKPLEDKKEPIFGIARVKMVMDGRLNKKMVINKLNELPIADKTNVEFVSVLSVYSQHEKMYLDELTGQILQILYLEVLLEEKENEEKENDEKEKESEEA